MTDNPASLVERLRRDGLKYQTDTFDEAAAALTAREEQIARLEGILRHIVGAANEAPKFGPFDCIDKHGTHYQSEDLASALKKARDYLSRTALEQPHD